MNFQKLVVAASALLQEYDWKNLSHESLYDESYDSRDSVIDAIVTKLLSEEWRKSEASVHAALEELRELNIQDSYPELPKGNFWAN